MKTILISIISFIISLFRRKQVTPIDYFTEVIPTKPIPNVVEDIKLEPIVIKGEVKDKPIIEVEKPIDKPKAIEVKKEPVPIIEKPNIPIKKIKFVDSLLPSNQHMGKRNRPITLICLHHTEGGSIEGCLSYWKETPDKVATNYVIDKNGDIYQTIEDSNWAYQLGLRSKDNNIDSKYKTKEWSDNLEQSIVGIELVCEGKVVKDSKGFYFEGGDRYIDDSKTVRLSKSFKGSFDYVKYTDEQIESLKDLINYLCDKHNIKKKWIGHFSISTEGLEMKSAVYSHVNFRTSGKNDLFPQPEIIEMLNNLK